MRKKTLKFSLRIFCSSSSLCLCFKPTFNFAIFFSLLFSLYKTLFVHQKRWMFVFFFLYAKYFISLHSCYKHNLWIKMLPTKFSYVRCLALITKLLVCSVYKFSNFIDFTYWNELISCYLKNNVDHMLCYLKMVSHGYW